MAHERLLSATGEGGREHAVVVVLEGFKAVVELNHPGRQTVDQCPQQRGTVDRDRVGDGVLGNRTPTGRKNGDPLKRMADATGQHVDAKRFQGALAIFQHQEAEALAVHGGGALKDLHAVATAGATPAERTCYGKAGHTAADNGHLQLRKTKGPRQPCLR